MNQKKIYTDKFLKELRKSIPDEFFSESGYFREKLLKSKTAMKKAFAVCKKHKVKADKDQVARSLKSYYYRIVKGQDARIPAKHGKPKKRRPGRPKGTKNKKKSLPIVVINPRNLGDYETMAEEKAHEMISNLFQQIYLLKEQSRDKDKVINTLEAKLAEIANISK